MKKTCSHYAVYSALGYARVNYEKQEVVWIDDPEKATLYHDFKEPMNVCMDSNEFDPGFMAHVVVVMKRKKKIETIFTLPHDVIRDFLDDEKARQN